MTIKKIGFACKYSIVDDKNNVTSVPEYNVRATTVAWLGRQTREVAEERMWDLITHNIGSIHKLVEKVSTLDDSLRMVRLGSDILPVFTHPLWSYFYARPDVVQYCEKHFRQVGDLARHRGVRLSFHPGQFCVLASATEDIVNRSIEEFEYHTDMARWMGYGKSFQDFKINVHISGKQGPEGIRKALKRLSPEARNMLTIENEEISYGLDDCLELADVVPIVLDIHHHWCKTGEYLSPMDTRVDRVVQSWRGVRPTMHYSVSREDYLVGHDSMILPDMAMLLDKGFKKQKLRAHSDFYWNKPVNQWALSHWEWADILCESKAKNLASFALFEQAKQYE